ncbi:gp55 sigma factor for T4 late transcription [Delftia phage PhiW-14]|uniref:Gp55 sigma factor for T4 late transcription n=1 Tax=Delftia phage PhiW-14 TaxID=665032 RepID=C9DGJ6_BPW14|nr:late sigma transcription factor [Delftia phage PhiW-14]ACV50247.1 gp55 sigma factor for T4 late transcription [Delftia phage PhiW-14]
MTEKSSKPSNHYVDNDKLNAVMVQWHHDIQAAKAAGLERPPMPQYVAECVIKMAHGKAKLHNYRDYSWKDEMILDAIEVCAMYLHNFNPEAKTRKGDGPNGYGYINVAIERAFNGRIDIEKREEYYKCKHVELLNGQGDLARDLAEETGTDASGVVTDFIDRAYQYEKNEKAKAERAAARKAKKDAKKPPVQSIARFMV